jgi:hypothetical protein
MAYASPVFRMVCGLVLVIVAVVKFFDIRRQLDASPDGELQVFGATIAAQPWHLTLVFGLAVLVGLVLLGLGAASLVKKIQEG